MLEGRRGLRRRRSSMPPSEDEGGAATPPPEEEEEELEEEEDMRKRHKAESRSLEGKTRSMLKKAPKPKKDEVEKEVKRLEEELAKRHEEELKALALAREKRETKAAGEEGGAGKGVRFAPTRTPDTAGGGGSAVEGGDEEEEEDSEEARARSKREKARRKKEKKAQRDAEEEAKREAEKEEIRKGAVNFREIEMGRLLEVLGPLGLGVAEIQADGHCLYRAVAQQLLATRGGGESPIEYTEVRRAAAEYMRGEPSDFLPFLDLPPEHQQLYEQDPHAAFLSYCDRVEKTAEWGGQLELRALVPIVVYSADAPPLEMGNEYAHPGVQPLRLTFHRHYYTLGEHYNAVVPLSADGGP